jgi:hypothetical protein
MATRKLPKGASTKRPSSRAYANNRAVIDNLVAPERVPAKNPSTMSGSRDVQRQAFAQEKTGVSKNYKMVDGKMVEIDEAEWKKAAQKFVKQEGTGKGTIKKGQTTANPPKRSRMAALKQAAIKVQGAEKTLNANDGLSAAERKMAREGNAPARAPATRSTPAPVAEAPKAPATSAAPKMTRAERSAANKAKHAGVRAAEEKKWAEQKSAKATKAPAAAKPKTTTAKPAAKTTTVKPAAPAKTTTAKPVVTKATKAAPAPKAKPQVAKPAAAATPQAAPSKAFSAGEKAGRAVKAIGVKGGAFVKNIGKGLFSAGSIGFTAATYSKDLGNKAADDAMGARLQAAVRQGRRDAAAAKPAAVKQAAPVQKKAKAAPAKSAAPKAAAPQKAAEMPKANPEKAIADFEAKLKSAGVVSIAGGAGGKAQMVQQPMSATQLEDQFKRKKGPR